MTIWARLWLIFALFILYGATIPFRFETDLQNVADNWSRVILDPTISPETGRRVSIHDMTQNLLLFMPFGLFAAGTFRRRWPVRIALATLCGALFSATVEGVQLFTLDRTTSYNDLLTNIAGTFVGAATFPIVDYVIARFIEPVFDRSPALYPLLVATAVLCVAAWQPYDVTLDAGSIWGKVKTLRVDPWQFKVLRDEGLEFLRYFLFGMIAVWWLRDLDSKAPKTRAAVAGVALAVALEASQILVESRMPGISDALAHGSGAVVGAAFSNIRQARPGLLFTLLAAATALGAAMFMLTPFTPDVAWHPFRIMPVNGYFSSPLVLSDAIDQALAFFPLGFALTLAQRVIQGWTLAVIATMAFAAPLEYMQGWIIGRVPDVTDIGLSLLGCFVGTWVGARGSMEATLPAQPAPDRSSPAGA